VYESDDSVEGFGGYIMTNNGYKTFIIYRQSEHIYGRDWILCGAEGNPVAEQRVAHEAEAKMGELSLVALERDRWKAIAGELAEALQCVGHNEVCWCGVAIGDPRYTDHSVACKRATAALAKYKQESKA
jgi:hypothetical protein